MEVSHATCRELDDATSNVTTVLLVDDEPYVLQGLEMLLSLEPDLLVVGTATTAETAMELAHQARPDVIVMDIRLPRSDGLTVAHRLRHELPGSKIIILSLYSDPAVRQQAHLAGAAAFLAKHDMHEALLATIRDVAAQPPLLPPTSLADE